MRLVAKERTLIKDKFSSGKYIQIFNTFFFTFKRNLI